MRQEALSKEASTGEDMNLLSFMKSSGRLPHVEGRKPQAARLKSSAGRIQDRHALIRLRICPQSLSRIQICWHRIDEGQVQRHDRGRRERNGAI